MPKKRPEAEKGPSRAYIVSFSDTMTTMLAFFIVLVSLAEEQTGANLHAGTGSFIRAMDSLGVPGLFSSGSKAVAQFDEMSPQYIVDDPENRPPDNESTGPDENDNSIPVIDREKEELQRFVQEMQRLSKTHQLPEVRGEVSFDFFNRISDEPPFLPDNFDAVLEQVYPLVKQNGYQVEIIVWATTPSNSAWQRATHQASSISHTIVKKGNLTHQDSMRLHAYGSPWMYSDVKRPAFSIVVRRVQAN